MTISFQVLDAMRYCHYKAWLLSKGKTLKATAETGNVSINPVLKIAGQIQSGNKQSEVNNTHKAKLIRQAQNLLKDTSIILSKQEPPAFYKIKHCSECQFKESCFKQLKEKDCISLLSGMTPKTLAKYHKKGITTITQLSHLFRPRRRNRMPQTNAFLFELKALAIREQKTFIMHSPELMDNDLAIYLDFEGLPETNRQYLLGALIVEDGKQQYISYWADSPEYEAECFQQLFALFDQYPDTPIFHYGSYETKALKKVVKHEPELFKDKWPAIEKRMVNLLGYLRTHVYPPTYGNGLKEVAAFLGYQWKDPDATGFTSIQWRKEWETFKSQPLKNRLLQYNLDDCKALYRVHQWFCSLSLNEQQQNIQQVSQMKKHTPYRFDKNLEFGEDFQLISKAAYFDYQRNKIYWRKENKKQINTSLRTILRNPPEIGKGAMVWKPKKVNDVIIAPPLKKCPNCGHDKLYQSHTIYTSVIQTDLKFTSTGIRQYVTEYKTGSSKCAKCRKKFRNHNLRMSHYGDNLFAFVTNCYINYYLSNDMISRLIREQFGIWVSPMYLVMYKNRWWRRNWQPVADYIKKIVLNSPVINIDETTVRLAKESGYVWVFATSHTVFYHYTSNREVGFLQELLEGYQGVIVSDFYPGYETLEVTQQKCLIHLIRDLNDDLFKNPFDEEYKKLVNAFSLLLKKIIATIDHRGLKKYYLHKHKKEVDKFHQQFIDKAYTSDLSVQYVKRLKKHWNNLWTFLDHDGIPWNNNNAEAAIKAFAQYRRRVNGQVHERGLREYLQMLSISQTCRYRNISFLNFLRKRNGIWENINPELLPRYLPFDQAKLYIHKLKFNHIKQWNEWKFSDKRPSFIPLNPEKEYRNSGWIDIRDWLGKEEQN